MTIKRMLADFLEVPGNMAAIEALCGAGSKNKPAPALWDAATVRYGRSCRTFDEAFAACCVGRRVASHRTVRRTRPDGSVTTEARPSERIEHGWAWFDLETMRECIPGVDFPPEVYEEQARRAQEEWARGLDGWADEVQAAYYAGGEPPCEDVTEDMIVGEAVALPLPPWAWRRAA